MTILGSIISLSNTNKLGKSQKLNTFAISSLQGANGTAELGDISKGTAVTIGNVTGLVTGAVMGTLDYTIEGAIFGLTRGLAFGIL